METGKRESKRQDRGRACESKGECEKGHVAERGKWKRALGKRNVESGHVESGRWKDKGGKWKRGKWKVESGNGKVEIGQWKVEDVGARGKTVRGHAKGEANATRDTLRSGEG